MSEDKRRTAYLFRVSGIGPRGRTQYLIFSEDGKHRVRRRYRQQAIDAMMHAWEFTGLVQYKGTHRPSEMAATMAHIDEERRKRAAEAEDANDPAESQSAT